MEWIGYLLADVGLKFPDIRQTIAANMNDDLENLKKGGGPCNSMSNN